MAIARRAVRPGATAPLKSGDPTVEELSRQLNDLKRSIPLFATQGVEVAFSVSGAGAFQVRHGLGRLASGFWLVDRNSPANIYRMNTGNSTTVLALFSSAACAGKIWVY